MSFHAERLALLDRQPVPTGRYVYTPLAAAIGLTRSCNVVCKHCAVAADPTAPEKVTIDALRRFMLEISDLKINTLCLEGGEPFLEPELLGEAVYLARDFRVVSLCTSADWASTPTETRRMLRYLYDRGSEYLLLIAANLDRFHAAVPLRNYVHLMQGVSYLPKGNVVFSHTRNPGDNTIQQFIALLKQEGFIVNANTYELDGDTIFESLDVRIGRQTSKFPIQNSHPVLVGRAKALRQDAEYMAWRRAMMGGAFFRFA
jgi:pyruvate-formate lyase-activating enzyme